jgi:hypothetical protein
MPYIGRTPTGVGSVSEIDGDLTVTGNIKSGGQLTANDTLFKMIMDTAADLGDNFLIEDGGTDGSGTNAGDDICLEKDLQVIPAGDIISISGVAGLGGSSLIDELGFGDTVEVAAGESFFITVIGVGGGGGGGGTNATSTIGGRGGSGGYASADITFNASGTLSYVVGTPGEGGAGAPAPGGVGSAGSGGTSTNLVYSNGGNVITCASGGGGAVANTAVGNTGADGAVVLVANANWTFNRSYTNTGARANYLILKPLSITGEESSDYQAVGVNVHPADGTIPSGFYGAGGTTAPGRAPGGVGATGKTGQVGNVYIHKL